MSDESEPSAATSVSIQPAHQRASSPAKRTAAEMEDGHHEVEQEEQQPQVQQAQQQPQQQQQQQPQQLDTDMDVDHPATDLNKEAPKATASPASGNGSAVSSAASSSNQDSGAPSTVATSASATTELPTASEKSKTTPVTERPSYDEQYDQVRQILLSHTRAEGQTGYLVASSWLARVLSRTTENQQSSDYPKEAREGEVGPVDNSSIQGLKLYTNARI